MTGIECAMVFAAGLGTRMGDLTKNCPKPLLQAGGRALIDHALDHVADAGIGRAVVNLHYLGERIRAHLAGRTSPEIGFSDEQPQILETGGGVVHALDRLGPGPFATINSDTVFAGRNPLALLSQGWASRRADALLLLVRRNDALGYTRQGDFFLDDPAGPPRRRGTANEAPLIYAGAQIIRPEALDDPPGKAFSLNVIWDRLLAAGRVGAVVYPDPWVDVGTPDGLVIADRVLSGRGP